MPIDATCKQEYLISLEFSRQFHSYGPCSGQGISTKMPLPSADHRPCYYINFRSMLIPPSGGNSERHSGGHHAAKASHDIVNATDSPARPPVGSPESNLPRHVPGENPRLLRCLRSLPEASSTVVKCTVETPNHLASAASAPITAVAAVTLLADDDDSSPAL